MIPMLLRYNRVLINFLNGHRHGSYNYQLKIVIIYVSVYLHAKIQLTIILMMLLETLSTQYGIWVFLLTINSHLWNT